MSSNTIIIILFTVVITFITICTSLNIKNQGGYFVQNLLSDKWSKNSCALHSTIILLMSPYVYNNVTSKIKPTLENDSLEYDIIDTASL